MLENSANTTERKNPFFEPYNTPHETVPFDKIRISDYEEAFIEGIRRDDEEIEKMVNDPEEPNFENTIVRVDNENGENYYDLLSRVSTAFSCARTSRRKTPPIPFAYPRFPKRFPMCFRSNRWSGCCRSRSTTAQRACAIGRSSRFCMVAGCA